MADLDDDGPTAEADNKRSSGDDGQLMRRLKRWERQARDHWSKWRDEARSAYDYVAGHQWSGDDKAKLLDQMRQPVTFNRIAPMVDAVTGAEILNRQEVRYIPREQGDVQVNEIITAADEWARELSDTEDEESDAFADVVICGLGWTDTLMQYNIDPEGRIVDERIDPLEMWAVPSDGQFQRNLGNARAIIRAKYWDRDEIKPAWRKLIPSDNVGASSLDDPTTGWTGPKDDYEHQPSEGQDTKRKRIWIRHIQWWEEDPAWRIADPTTGQAATLTAKQFSSLKKMYASAGMQPPEAIEIEQRKFYYAILCGSVFLEKKTEIEAGSFTFKAITGKRDHNSNTFFGAVRAMVDPQMWGNKFFVQIMHILNTSAKGGLLYESESFANPRKALEDWSKPDAAIELKRGSLSGAKPALQERTPAVFPAGLEKIMEFSLTNLPQSSGINLEMLGLVERDQPGVLEMQRKKAGYAILAVFFDSLRRYRKEKGRVRLYFIQHYLSDGRLIKIKGKDSTLRYVPLVKQADTATYDVIVDEAAMSPNQKEQTWMMLQAMLPLLTKLAVPPQIWMKLLEYSPLPSSVSSDMIQILKEQAEQPPPPDPEMVKIQAQVEGEKAKLAMKAQSDQQQAQIDQQQAEQEMALELQKAQAQLEIEREKAEIEKAKLMAEIEAMREKNALQQQADWQKLQYETAAQQQKAAVEQETGQMKLDFDRRAGEQKIELANKAAKDKATAEKPKGRKLSVKREGGKLSEASVSYD